MLLELSFQVPPVCKEDINKILKSLNTNKATVPDGMPLKFIKLSTNVICDLISQMEQRTP